MNTNDFKQVCESYLKTLNVIKDSLVLVAESTTGERKDFLECVQVALETLINNVPNIEKEFTELHERYEVENTAKNNAYFFILESGNFYKYKKWFFHEKDNSDIKVTLEKFRANNMNAPKKKKK